MLTKIILSQSWMLLFLNSSWSSQLGGQKILSLSYTQHWNLHPKFCWFEIDSSIIECGRKKIARLCNLIWNLDVEFSHIGQIKVGKTFNFAEKVYFSRTKNVPTLQTSWIFRQNTIKSSNFDIDLGFSKWEKRKANTFLLQQNQKCAHSLL